MEEERKRIGVLIAEIRSVKRMTQQEVADIAKLKRSNISRIESGMYNVTLDTLAKIASALGKRIDFVD